MSNGKGVYILLIGGDAVKEFDSTELAEEEAMNRIKHGNYRGTVKVVKLVAEFRPGPPVKIVPEVN